MMNEVKLIDCMEFIKDVPDNSLDLIITSPPYNLGETHHTGNNKFKAYSLYSDNLPEEEYQLYNGGQLIFSMNDFTSMVSVYQVSIITQIHRGVVMLPLYLPFLPILICNLHCALPRI